MRRRLWTFPTATLLICCLSLASGCQGGLTIGPRVKTEYVVLKPGAPIEVLRNVRVPGMTLKDGLVLDAVDIGGWVAMPPEHFEALRAAVEAKGGG